LLGPEDAAVSAGGQISGWVPQGADIGHTFDFEVQASNAVGSDTESWQVYVPPAPPGFIEQDGLLVVEAEHFDGCAPGTLGHSWSILTGLNAAADGYVESGPNDGTNINSPDIEAASPRLSYTAKLGTAGTYYVWSRALGPDYGSDSFHYGLDGVSATGGYDDCAQAGGVSLFAWYSQTPTHVRTTLHVPTPGTYALNVWMREAGTAIDRLLLTTNSGYTPSGGGPAESPRSQTVPGDLDHDGDVDLADFQIFDAVLAGPGSSAAEPESDLDGDGDCDLADFGVFAHNFSGGV
jgi:hypothetical protein